MSHTNAVLTPRARLRLAKPIVKDHWPVAEAAKLLMVSQPTARKWAARFRHEGPAGMSDRSQPSSRDALQDPAAVREEDREAAMAAPAWSGPERRRARSACLDGARCAGALSDQPAQRIDRVTGEQIRRYERPHPGSLIHVDVTKFGNIPDGGGRRFVGRQQGGKNKSVTARQRGRTDKHHPNIGAAFLRAVIDDRSRVAYVEICPDEKSATAIAVLRRAVAWYADHEVTVECVLSDNGSAYRSHAWRDACQVLGIRPKMTRPYRPQTNGKIERFHHTLADGCAYAKFYGSESERRDALPAWIHFYNHHRHRAAIGAPAISRLNNLPGYHS